MPDQRVYTARRSCRRCEGEVRKYFVSVFVDFSRTALAFRHATFRGIDPDAARRHMVEHVLASIILRQPGKLSDE